MKDGVQQDGMTGERWCELRARKKPEQRFCFVGPGTFNAGRNKAKRERRKLKGVRK